MATNFKNTALLAYPLYVLVIKLSVRIRLCLIENDLRSAEFQAVFIPRYDQNEMPVGVSKRSAVY